MNTSSYVDINSFFATEINRLDSLKPSVIKFSEWNNTKNTDTSVITDWDEELALFKDFNLPLAVWKTEFEIIDSIRHNGVFTRTFSTTVPEQIIREFSVSTDDAGRIQRVEGEVRTTNRLSSSQRKLSYTINKGYSIAGGRKTKMFPNESFRIVCQFTNQKTKE